MQSLDGVQIAPAQAVQPGRAVEIHTALALVAAGLGVTLVGRSVAENNRNDIVFVPISDMTIDSRMVAVTRANETGKTIEAFLNVLLDRTPR